MTWNFWMGEEEEKEETDEGCTAHHFDEHSIESYNVSAKARENTYAWYDENGDLDTVRHTCYGLSEEDAVVFMAVEAFFVAVCEHEGCREKDRKKEYIGYVTSDQLEELAVDGIPEHEDEL